MFLPFRRLDSSKDPVKFKWFRKSRCHLVFIMVTTQEMLKHWNLKLTSEVERPKNHILSFTGNNVVISLSILNETFGRLKNSDFPPPSAIKNWLWERKKNGTKGSGLSPEAVWGLTLVCLSQVQRKWYEGWEREKGFWYEHVVYSLSCCTVVAFSQLHHSEASSKFYWRSISWFVMLYWYVWDTTCYCLLLLVPNSLYIDLVFLEETTCWNQSVQ